MADTLIKVDLAQSAYENEQVHNRWHPDIPMACWVNPGDEFILETYDWTGGFIKNNELAVAGEQPAEGRAREVFAERARGVTAPLLVSSAGEIALAGLPRP